MKISRAICRKSWFTGLWKISLEENGAPCRTQRKAKIGSHFTLVGGVSLGSININPPACIKRGASLDRTIEACQHPGAFRFRSRDSICTTTFYQQAKPTSQAFHPFRIVIFLFLHER